MKRTFLAAFFFILSFQLHAAEDGGFNILWITCEDMSPRIGCYGDNTVPTPNIDRLAAEGVRYTNCYGTYGVCAPNRHTITMGMYPTSTGAMAMRNWKRTSALKFITDPELLAIPTYEAVPPPQAKCMSEYLRAAGWYCSNNSKTDYQMQTPLSAWDDTTKKAHWRNRPDPNQRFFAIFNDVTPHESGTFKQRSPTYVDPATLEPPPYYPDTKNVRQSLAWHYDNIYAMDQWVGGLLKQLEEDGLMDKTLIFFYSDHGDGLPRAKRWVYDSGLKVPFIVRWPDGHGAGTVNDELVSFVDLAPTTLSLAGLKVPDHMEGQVFLGPNRDEPRRYIYACRDRMDPAPERIRAVRDQRFKYVRNYRPDLPYIGYIPYRDQAPIMQDINALIAKGERWENSWQFFDQTKPEEELYDCETDPWEIHNLADDPKYADKLAELRAAHEDWKATYGDLGEIPETELIKKLWPPDGKQPTTATPEVSVKDGTVTLTCASEGASIVYRTSPKGDWRLYTGPFSQNEAKTLEAQAHRYGWKVSKTASNAPDSH